MRWFSKWVMACAAVALCSGAAGAADTAGARAPGAELKPIVIGSIPNQDAGVLYLAQKQGFFADEGLSAKIVMAQSGAALIPSLVSGQFDLSFTGVTSLMQAVAQGLKLQAVAQASASMGTPDRDINDILTLDPTIRSARDLEGKRVAVNGLRNMMELLVRVSVDHSGADSNAVQYVELPFSRDLQAAKSGQIDAWICSEPFCQMNVDNGANRIAIPWRDLAPSSTVAAVYVTTAARVERDRDLIARAQRAINRALAYAQDNQAEVRGMLPAFLDIPADVIDAMALSRYNSTLTGDDLKPITQASVRYGILKAEPENYDSLVFRP